MTKTKESGTHRNNGSSTKSSTDDQRTKSSSKTAAASDQAQKGKVVTGKSSMGIRKNQDSQNNRSGGENMDEE